MTLLDHLCKWTPHKSICLFHWAEKRVVRIWASNPLSSSECRLGVLYTKKGTKVFVWTLRDPLKPQQKGITFCSPPGGVAARTSQWSSHLVLYTMGPWCSSKVFCISTSCCCVALQILSHFIYWSPIKPLTLSSTTSFSLNWDGLSGRIIRWIRNW